MINSNITTNVTDIKDDVTESKWAVNKGILSIGNGKTFSPTKTLTKFDALRTFMIYENYQGNVIPRTTNKDKNENLKEQIRKMISSVVEQIVVTQDNEVILIPKVGNFRIRLGDLENVDQKMEKLYLFLREGIALKGWNKYKEINLEYRNQIVCVKK